MLTRYYTNNSSGPDRSDQFGLEVPVLFFIDIKSYSSRRMHIYGLK
jgi:hypothetical protein